MAKGCLGIQFYVETGRMEVATLLNMNTGLSRSIVMFPRLHKRKDSVIRYEDSKRAVTPNFCPSCGTPFILDGDQAGEPGCVGGFVEEEANANNEAPDPHRGER